jgi:catechol 1,2-dioxygenase
MGVEMTEGRTPSVTSEYVTEQVVAAMSAAPDRRIRELLTELVRHAHEFARAVRLTPAELLRAAEYLRACGRISDDARHEFILLADVLGITMVTETLAGEVPDGAFESSVLGPFYRAGAPLEEAGADISRGERDGEPALVRGRVLDGGGRPVSGAELDVWGTNRNGLYENVDPAQPDFNLRGRFRTGADGRFEFWTVKPVSYPIPDDGPVGELLRAAGRHNMRPGHLHIIASAPGYRTVVSELYTDDDPYLHQDAVFGVKPSLVVGYRRVGDPRAVAAAARTAPFWELERDIVLVPGEHEAVTFTSGRPRERDMPEG